MGGKAKNMHVGQRERLTGRGGVDKMAVAGVKDRATNRVSAAVVDTAWTDRRSRASSETARLQTGRFTRTRRPPTMASPTA